MPDTFTDLKRRTLKERLAGLHQLYEAANNQLSQTLSAVDRVRIQRQITGLEAEIQEAENEWRQLEADGQEIPDPQPGLASPLAAAPDLTDVNPAALRKAMHRTYDRADLEILCKDLGLGYDDLRGETLEAKIMYLIDRFQRRLRYGELVRKVLEDRPGLSAELGTGETEGTHSVEAKSAPNPFGDLGRISDPERFFNREELLRQIFEELGKGVNLSLVGESQIGKSSLLSMVCAKGPERMGLPPEAFAYLSLQTVDDEDDFYEALCDALRVETCRGYALVRALRDTRVVLCLDEIDKMAWEGFTVRLRSHLRGLADGPDAPLKLVVASRSPLVRLFPDSPELDSPLAGICRQLGVGPFSTEAVHAFLAHRLRGSGVSFSASEVEKLLTETGGHPAELQRAAADLYRRLTRHNTRKS